MNAADIAEWIKGGKVEDPYLSKSTFESLPSSNRKFWQHNLTLLRWLQSRSVLWVEGAHIDMYNVSARHPDIMSSIRSVFVRCSTSCGDMVLRSLKEGDIFMTILHKIGEKRIPSSLVRSYNIIHLLEVWYCTKSPDYPTQLHHLQLHLSALMVGWITQINELS